jgi:hypothetical protein
MPEPEPALLEPDLFSQLFKPEKIRAWNVKHKHDESPPKIRPDPPLLTGLDERFNFLFSASRVF